MNKTSTKIYLFKLGLLTSVAMGGFGISPVFSQESEVKLEEVIVTARKREESIQDTPVAITAFTSKNLALSGTTDITELAQRTPSLLLEPSRASNSTLTAFIRGVGQQDPLAGFEPGVALYMDDVYLARPQGALLEVLDVERIEILRGPQGTLYGRNAMGGAIKYVTRRLGDEFEGNLIGRYGSYGQFDIVGSVNLPVSDSFKVGIAATKLTRNGFGKNINLNKDNYNKDLGSARITAELTPSDNLFMRISADYTKDSSNPKHGHRLFEGITSGAPVLDNVYDTRAGADTSGLTIAFDGDHDVTNKGVSGLIEYDVSDSLVVKSVTAYREDYSESIIDFDSLPHNQLDAAAIYENSQFSQELQLLYTGEKVDTVAGFYFIDADAANNFDLTLGALGPLGTYTGGDFNTKSWSAFAEMTYELSEKLDLTLGGRYTDDKRSADVDAQLILGPPSVALGGTGVNLRTDGDFTNSRTFTQFTPKVMLSYKASEDMISYVSFSQGFKAGGFDPRAKNKAPGAEDVVNGYKPESLNSYEVGLKSTLNNGRAQTNIAVFYSDLKDMQIAGSIPIDSDGDGTDDNWAGSVTNAGKAQIKGIEFEGRIAVTENFSISSSLSLVDASIKEWLVRGVDISGQREMQNTPKYQANITANYSKEMGSGTLNSMLSWSGTGDSHQFETPQPAFDQRAYGIWNSSLVWSNDRFNIGLHAKNIGDTRYITSGYDFMSLIGLVPDGVLTAFYGAPRTVTLQAGFSF